MRWSRISGIAAALLALPWGAEARADDARDDAFRLVWVRGDGTESCADRAAIAGSVTRRLDKNVFSESARRSIEGVVQHEGEVWEAHIYVRDRDGKLNGSRILTSRAPTCAAIEAAATLAIALAIDPEAALRSAPATPPASEASPGPAGEPPSSPPQNTPPPPPPPAASPPAPVAPPPPVATPPPPCPVERPCPPAAVSASPRAAPGAVALRAVLGLGLLPAASPGIALAVETAVHSWIHASGGVLYLPEQRTADGDFAFGLTATWLGACAAPWATPRASLSLCANGLLGAIHSVVFALEPERAGDRVWAGASLDGVFRARLVDRLQAELGAQLVVPLTQYRFDVASQPGTVFRQGTVTGVGFAGAGMSFP